MHLRYLLNKITPEQAASERIYFGLPFSSIYLASRSPDSPLMFGKAGIDMLPDWICFRIASLLALPELSRITASTSGLWHLVQLRLNISSPLIVLDGV